MRTNKTRVPPHSAFAFELRDVLKLARTRVTARRHADPDADARAAAEAAFRAALTRCSSFALTRSLVFKNPDALLDATLASLAARLRGNEPELHRCDALLLEKRALERLLNGTRFADEREMSRALPMGVQSTFACPGTVPARINARAVQNEFIPKQKNRKVRRDAYKRASYW